MSLIFMFADLHKWPYKEFATYPGGINSRLIEGAQVLTDVLDLAVEKHADMIFFLGDWFEEKDKVDVVTVDASWEAMGLSRFRPKGDNPLSYVAVAGNHDSIGMLNGKHFTSYAYLQEMFTKVVVAPELCPLEGKDTYAVFLPHTPKDTAVGFMKDVYYQVAKDATLYVFGHMDIEGAIAGPNELKIGRVTPTSLFNDSRVKGVFLGHFHKHQKIGRNIYYVGSPIQKNFGEEREQKGVMTLDTVTGEVKFIPLTVRTSFHTVKITTEADLADISELLDKENVKVRVQPDIELDRELINDLRRAGIRVEVKPTSKSVVRIQATADDDDNIENIVPPYVAQVSKDKARHKVLVKTGIEKLREG